MGFGCAAPPAVSRAPLGLNRQRLPTLHPGAFKQYIQEGVFLCQRVPLKLLLLALSGCLRFAKELGLENCHLEKIPGEEVLAHVMERAMEIESIGIQWRGRYRQPTFNC